MWLGKALFLKGEDRRGQAVEEYREGLKVLEKSKADQDSPSMALFRSYLGTALLENGEVWSAHARWGREAVTVRRYLCASMFGRVSCFVFRAESELEHEKSERSGSLTVTINPRSI